MASDFVKNVLKKAKSSRVRLAKDETKEDLEKAEKKVVETPKLKEKKIKQVDLSNSFVDKKEEKLLPHTTDHSVVDYDYEDVAVKESPALPVRMSFSDRVKGLLPANFKNKKFFKNRLGWNRKLKKWAIFAFSYLLVISLTASFFLLGYDEKMFGFKFEGVVLDSSGEKIEGAEIEIQDRDVETGEDGRFSLKNLESGTFVMKIQAEDYKTIEQEVKIERFGESDQKFVLEKQKYANLTGKLNFTGKEIDSSNLVLKIDEEEVSVDSAGNFELENVEIKKVSITLTSSIYKDLSLDYELEANQQNVINTITLIPARDFRVSARDWFSGENISEVSLTYNNNEFLSDENGVFEFEDMDLDDSAEIKLSKEGYVDFEKTVKFDGNDIGIELVPDYQLVYTKTEDGVSNLYSSNIDGSGEAAIATNRGNISDAIKQDSEILFFSDKDGSEQIYSYSLNDRSIIKESDLRWSYVDDQGRDTEEYAFLKHKKILSLHKPNGSSSSNDLEFIITDLNGNNAKTIYNSAFPKGTVLKIKTPKISESGDWIGYVISEYNSDGVFIQSRAIVTDFDRTKQFEIYKTSYSNVDIEILGIPEGNKMSLLLRKENDEEVLMTVDLQDAGKNEKNLEDVKINRETITFVENEIYFVSDDGNLYRFDLENGELKELLGGGKIRSFFIDSKESYLFYQEGEKLMIKSLDNLDLVKETGIKSNFKMW